MSMRTVVVVFASMISFSCQRAEKSELERYLDSIRESGMAVEAHQVMNTVADLRLGYSAITYKWDEESGGYSTTFASLTCPIPGTDPLQMARTNATRDSMTRAEVERLRPLADSDTSGFITAAEAQRFQMLVEFGLLAKHIAENEHGQESVLAKAKHLSPDRFGKLKAEYLALCTKAHDLGNVTIAPWPFE